jgi:hypothetical protein
VRQEKVEIKKKKHTKRQKSIARGVQREVMLPKSPLGGSTPAGIITINICNNIWSNKVSMNT